MKMKRFNQEEIEKIKQRSISFPYLYEHPEHGVVAINEVVGLSGFSGEDSVPQEITVYHHVKGKGRRKMTYRLSESA